MTGGTDHLDLAGRDPLIPSTLDLRDAVAGIVARKATLRQERLSGIHNPWGHAVAFTDPWAFLDLCESSLVLDAACADLGPDFILWDSELFPESRVYGAFLGAGREGRYWPVAPRAGAVILVPVSRERPEARAVPLDGIGAESLAGFAEDEPLYVIRLLPATSRFERDPGHPAHRACMEEQLLVNYANRPLWLLSGNDRAANDLTTGFAPAVPVWASGPKPINGEET